MSSIARVPRVSRSISRMADASSATLVRREAALGGRASGDEAEGTTSAAPTEDRLTKAASLLAWVESEGATVSSVSAASSSGAGVGLYAARDLQIGEEAFRCPCKLALTADAAAADPLIGGPLRELRVDEEHSILLMLLHCARLGRTSYWSAYVDALPTEDELVPLLPAFWPHSELELLLGGTPLLAQARAAHAALCEFHESVVIGQLDDGFDDFVQTIGQKFPSIEPGWIAKVDAREPDQSFTVLYEIAQ